MSRRQQQAAFANPVLIGAVTVLVAIVAVFLAYNANNGLPFVPTRELRVDFANGAALVPGDQVTSAGGYRIGVVADMLPVRLRSGVVGAEAVLHLNRSFGAVPVDSTAAVRPRSLLGLKYVDLERGTSGRVVSDGGLLPASQTSIPVQFDDINKLFDARTRPAVEQDLVGFGDTLTGRGGDLNDTFAALPSLFGHLIPVARYLSDPRTQLTRLFSSLDAFFATVSPVAQANVRLFADQASTYEALSRDPVALASTIEQSPPTLDVGTDSLRAQQPFLADLRTFSGYLVPASLSLREALPNVDPALEAGIRVLPRTPAVNVKLKGVLAALRSLALDPQTNMAVNGLAATVGILNPMIRYLGPYVTVCNNWDYFWSELADDVSEQSNFGMSQRALLNSTNHQANNVNDAGATASANGYRQGDPPASSDAEYLHGPAYAAAVTNSGAADCETGQRGYPLKLNHLDPQNRALVTDQYTPGAQGTNWTGRSQVPPGETFSRKPLTGPQTPVIPGNS